MALLSEFLGDPFFGAKKKLFDVTRYAEDVDSDGVNQPLPKTIRGVIGIIETLSEQSLMRLADGSRLSNTIEIHTTFPLTSGANGQQADEIQWQGETYTVTDVADWSDFEEGHYRAICEMVNLKPGQPI